MTLDFWLMAQQKKYAQLTWDLHHRTPRPPQASRAWRGGRGWSWWNSLPVTACQGRCQAPECSRSWNISMTFPPMPHDTDLRLFVLPSVPASPLPDLLMTTLIRSLIFDNRGERSDWWHCVTAACLLAPAAPPVLRQVIRTPPIVFWRTQDSQLTPWASLGFGLKSDLVSLD